MIQMGTMLLVADNSGARKLQAIRQLGGSAAPRYAGVGDIIVCSVKEAAPESEVKKGTVVKAVVVRTRSRARRRIGHPAANGDRRAAGPGSPRPGERGRAAPA